MGDVGKAEHKYQISSTQVPNRGKPATFAPKTPSKACESAFVLVRGHAMPPGQPLPPGPADAAARTRTSDGYRNQDFSRWGVCGGMREYPCGRTGFNSAAGQVFSCA